MWDSKWQAKVVKKIEQGIHGWYKGSNMRSLVSDVYDKQNKKKKNVSKCSWLTWRLKYLLKDYSTYDRIRMTNKGYENETQYVVA